jgi:hypothetical protein
MCRPQITMGHCWLLGRRAGRQSKEFVAQVSHLLVVSAKQYGFFLRPGTRCLLAQVLLVLA